MPKEMPGPDEVAELVKSIQEKAMVSGYRATAEQDGLHVRLDVVFPWKEVESK